MAHGISSSRRRGWRPGTPVIAALAIVLSTVLAALPASAAQPAVAWQGAQAPVNAAVDAAAAVSDAFAPTVTADPLPTVQIDGVVWTQAIVGDWVYAAGRFSSARPAGAAPGTGETPRANLLRYRLTTGELDPGFDVPVNGAVYALTASPDGRTLYLGGAFTQVGTQPRYRVAALDTVSGAVSPLSIGANATVYGLAATADTLYLTGGFSTINNKPHARVGAASTLTGKVLPFDATLTGDGVGRSIAVSPDRSKIVVGGSFEAANGSTNPGRGIAALDASTGATVPWAMNSLIHNAGSAAGFMGVTSDETSVYGTTYSFDGGGMEGTFRAAWTDGSIITMEDCHGDVYDVALSDGLMYRAGHTHACATVPGGFPDEDPLFHTHALAFSMNASGRALTANQVPTYLSYEGQPAPTLRHWYPTFTPGSFTGQEQATWSVAAGGGYVVYGGEFPAVQGTPQQGLVRFASSRVAPNKQGPVVTGGAYGVHAASALRGEVVLTWTSNYDPDDASLTYAVERRGESAPLFTTSVASTRWNRPVLSYRDQGRPAGSVQEYRVVVSDVHGNSTASDWTAVTVSSTDSTEQNVIAADGFSRTESTGWGVAAIGGRWLTSGGAGEFSMADSTANIALAPGQTRGALLDSVQTSDSITRVRVSVDRASEGGVVSANVHARVVGSAGYSARVRFEPGGVVRLYLLQGETLLGGKSVVLTGYTPGTDVLVAVSARGTAPTQLGAKIWAAAAAEPSQWQITATDTTPALQAAGAIGLGGSSSSLSTVPVTTVRFDDYSVTDGRPLGSSNGNTAPRAAFSSSTDALTASFDAAASTDAEGAIRQYLWDFGDGTSGSGSTAQHAYAQPGQYTVTLTVTDAAGATNAVSQLVSVLADPPAEIIARDDFARTASASWGSAVVGGPWLLRGGDGEFSVSGDAGRIELRPSWTRTATLTQATSASTTVETTFSADAVPTGAGAVSLSVIGRQTTAGSYQARVRIEAGGTVRLYLLRDEVSIAGSGFVLPGTYRAGEALHVRLRVSGGGPTAAAAKLWRDGSSEPADWQLSGSDGTDGMQTAGWVGLKGTLSASTTAPRIVLSISDFQATGAAR